MSRAQPGGTTRWALLAGSMFSVACSHDAPRFRYGPQHDPPAGVQAAEGPSFDPARMERSMMQLGCTACHTFHGERLVGPPLGGLGGDVRRFADGTTGVVDLAYLAESIRDPGRRVVEGYDPVMPSYADQIDDATALSIAAYLLSLR